MLCNDPETRPQTVVRKITYLGCIEIVSGSMILAGDRMVIDGQDIGVVVGFAETHAPNHLNIVIRASGALLSGGEMGIEVGQSVTFLMSDEYKAMRGS